MSKDNKRCDFCLLKLPDIRHMYLGVSASICEDCVMHLYGTPIQYSAKWDLASNPAQDLVAIYNNIKRPSDIKNELDKYIIGQEQAKRALSVAVHNHLKRKLEKRNNKHIVLDKTNVLLLGPTGCGKTALIKALQNITSCPVGIADATVLTEAGTWGGDVSSIIWPLLQATNKNIPEAEYGIVYLDEADKIAATRGRDITTTGVQRELLKILEGSTVDVLHSTTNGGGKHHAGSTVVNTQNILFILGGAFSDITDANNKKNDIGFTGSKNKKEKIGAKDVINYGFMPELVGRLHTIVELDGLEREDLVRILTEPKNSLVSQYEEIFRMDNVILEFTDQALESIADYAILRKTGARGLKQILEEVLFDFMYDVKIDESYSVLITSDIVNEKLKEKK